jgi:hypothetical protein
MTKTITRNEYELLTFLKSSHDQLERLSNRFYYYAKKILDLDNDEWLVDYFDNDILSVTEFLNNVNIDIEQDNNEKN